jgi:hypothetical protein
MALGKSVSFTINSSYFEKASTTIPTSGALSITGWVYIKDFNAYNVLAMVGPLGGWFIIYTVITTGYLRFDMWGNYNDYNVAFPLNAWHMITVTYDGVNTSVIYIDDNPVSTVNTHGAIVWGSSAFSIGYPYNSNFLADEVRVYDKVLSGPEVTALYNSGNGSYGVPAANLVGGWHLDEGSGLYAADYSGQGNHLTCAESPAIAWENGVVSIPAATNISKVCSMSYADIAKINKIAIADVKKIGSILPPAHILGKSILVADSAIVNIGNPANLQLSSGTISCWIKWVSNSAGTYDFFICKTGAYNLMYRGGCITSLDFESSTEFNYVLLGYDLIRVDDGNWHHVVFTFQDGVVNGTSIYVDTAIQVTSTWHIANQAGNLSFGARPDYTPQQFNGNVDEIKIYSDIKDQAWVIADYNLGVGTYGLSSNPNIISGWHMDEGADATISDFVGDNDGTFGSPAPTWAVGKLYLP